MKFSSGATAGIALGCAFAGAAITSAIFLLIYRRQSTNRPQSNRHQSNRHQSNPKPKKSNPPKEERQPKLDERYKSVLNNLPQDLVNDQLKDLCSGLMHWIHVFVRGYIHMDPIAAGTIDTDKLERLLGRGASDWTSTQWATALYDPENRQEALQSYLMRVLYTRIDPEGDPDTTLLPVDILRFYQQLFPGNTTTYSQQMMDHWRTMTAYLLRDKYKLRMGLTDNTPVVVPEGDPRLDNINRTVAEMLDFCRPMICRPEEDVIEILSSEVHMAASYGYRFFLQKEPMKMIWPPSSSTRVAISPEVLRDTYRMWEHRVVTMTVFDAQYEELLPAES